MKKRLALLLPVLMLLGGCSLLKPVLGPGLEVSPAELTGMVTVEEGGFLARWIVTGGEGEVGVGFGDGNSDRLLGQDGAVLVEHLYTEAGRYVAVFHRGMKLARSVVTVNQATGGIAPEVYELWSTQGHNVVEEELMRFLVPYREFGCDSATGAPLFASGVNPGTGTTEFMLEVFDQDGKPVSVFISYAGGPDDISEYTWNGVPIIIENVWGEWLVLDEPIKTSLQHIYVFANWHEDYPRNAIWPDTLTLAADVIVMGCDDDVCGPWDIEVEITDYWMDFVFCARSRARLILSDWDVVTWRVYVSPRSCV